MPDFFIYINHLFLLLMFQLDQEIPTGKRVYFASDFHLGAPDSQSSRVREKKIIAWLDQIKEDAHAIFLVGDIFDFWFEYKRSIPKGFSRFQGKIAELTDQGIPVLFFTGNHDIWMFDYFEDELGVSIHRQPELFTFNEKRILVGHGDGLGPGDRTYKLLKKIFTSKVCQWLFARVHPNTGIGLANGWSQKSRISSTVKEEKSQDQEEWLLTYCKGIEAKSHHDYYVFGHRHLPLELEVNDISTYINLGEWVNYFTYGVFDGKALKLKTFNA